jgi:hypothetical protein
MLMGLEHLLLHIREKSSKTESLPGGITKYTVVDAPNTAARVGAALLSFGFTEFFEEATTKETYYYYYGDLYLAQTKNEAAEVANKNGVERCQEGDFEEAQKLFNAAYQVCEKSYTKEQEFLNSKESMGIAIEGHRLLEAKRFSEAKTEFQKAYDLSSVGDVYSTMRKYRDKSDEQAAQLAAEEKARKEAARLAAEKKAREEAARLAAEQKAREEAARLAAEKKAREEAARLAAEKKAREEAARLAAEQKAREEAARLAAEKKAREEAARLTAEKKAREEAARLAAEQKAREEAARLAAEKKAREETAKQALDEVVRVDETNISTNLQRTANPQIENESLQVNAISMQTSTPSARWSYVAEHFARDKSASNIINHWKEMAEALKLNRQGLKLFSEGKLKEAVAEIESALEKYEEAVSKFNEAAIKQPLDAIFNSFIKMIDAFIKNEAYDEAGKTIKYAKDHFPGEAKAFLDAEKMIEKTCWYPNYANTYLIQLDLEALENNIKEQSDGY